MGAWARGYDQPPATRTGLRNVERHVPERDGMTARTSTTLDRLAEDLARILPPTWACARKARPFGATEKVDLQFATAAFVPILSMTSVR